MTRKAPIAFTQLAHGNPQAGIIQLRDDGLDIEAMLSAVPSEPLPGEPITMQRTCRIQFDTTVFDGDRVAITSGPFVGVYTAGAVQEFPDSDSLAFALHELAT